MRLVCLAPLLLATACGGGTEPTPGPDGPAPVASVAITSPVTSLMIGSTAQLAAEPRDAAGTALTGRAIAWTSSDTTILSITAAGMATGRAVGTATVTATSEGRSGSVQLTVSLVPVGRIVVTPAQDTLIPGATVQLAAATSSAAGTPLPGRPVTWSSADPTIAVVDAAGLVRGVGPGTVAITGTSEDVSASASITVLPPVASVTVTPALDTLYLGQTFQLTASLRDADGAPLTGRAVQWTSSATDVARVTDDGHVVAWSTGTALISARSEGVAGTATIVVRLVPVDSVDLFPSAATIVVGGGLDLAVLPYDSAGNILSGRVETIDVRPGGIVTLDGDHLTGAAVGAVDVTATVETVAATAHVRVVQVSFAAVDAGSTQTCGLAADKAAFCWGFGNGNMAQGPVPRGVPGDPAFDRIRAGDHFSCGLLAGATKCWGEDPVTGGRDYAPRAIAGPSFTDIDVGDEFACGLTAAGAAYCWGQNYIGQLGNGTTTASVTPVAVIGSHVFSAIAVGRFHACGLAAAGEVYCWGGESGFTTPRLVSGGVSFTALAGGSCGLDAAGTAYCWNDTQASPTPQPVAGYTFASLTTRDAHVCGLDAGGTAYCWGDNTLGQLGTGDFDASTTPRAVAGGRRYVALTAGTTQTCGIATDGLLYCWGNGLAIGSGNGYGYAAKPTLVTGQP